MEPPLFNGNGETFRTDWKIALPALWSILPILMVLIPSLSLSFAFRSAYLLVLLLVVLASVYAAFFSALYFLHPMHFGRRKYTDGELLLGNSYFGIRRSGKGSYTCFSLKSARVGQTGHGTLKVSDLTAVVINNGFPVAEVRWSWWKVSVSLKFVEEETAMKFVAKHNEIISHKNSGTATR